MKLHAAVALAALLALGACGLKGGLEKPPPMWGETREQFEAEKRARAEAAAKAKADEEAQRQKAAIPTQPPSSPVSPKQ